VARTKKPPEQKPLTENELRFVEEFIADGSRNATQAFFRAYGRIDARGRLRSYAASRKQASVLLTKPHIAAELQAVRSALGRRTRVSAERTIRELAAVAFADVGDAFDRDPAGGPDTPRRLHEIPPATRRAIQKVKVKRRTYTARDGGEGRTVVEVEVEYTLASKNDALDKLCRHLGITKDGAGLEALAAAVRAALAGSAPPAPERPAADPDAAAGPAGVGP
jgi:phage terminase small subunit